MSHSNFRRSMRYTYQSFGYTNSSMFTRDWSFETAGSSREAIESIDPFSTSPEVLQGFLGQTQSTVSTNVQQSLARSRAAPVPVVKKKEQSQKGSETIPCHPAIKYVNHSLIVVLNFAPNIGEELTDITSLLTILPQYVPITTFIHLSIRDVPLVRDIFEVYCERMKSINSILSVLDKFDKIEHFQTQIIGGNSMIPHKSSYVGDGDNGEPAKYAERRSAIGARLRKIWLSKFCSTLDQEERDRINKFWRAFE